MSFDEELVPLPVPPLHILLAAQEKELGRPLSEIEINKIRDDAVCVMVPRSKRATVEEGKIVDIDFENAAIDWHKRRIEFVESCWPSVVLYVLTGGAGAPVCREILNESGFDVSRRDFDKGLTKHVISQMSGIYPADQDELSQIARHTTYYVVRSQPFKASEALAQSKRFLSLIRALAEAPALSLSLESAGLAHSLAAWRAVSELAAQDELAALVSGFVAMPIRFEDIYYSCGMHMLGLPDFIISASTLSATGCAPERFAETARDLFQEMGYFLLSEGEKFQAGHTFSLTRESGKVKAQIESCKHIAEEDVRFNPFGMLRLLPE